MKKAKLFFLFWLEFEILFKNSVYPKEENMVDRITFLSFLGCVLLLFVWKKDLFLFFFSGVKIKFSAYMVFHVNSVKEAKKKVDFSYHFV